MIEVGQHVLYRAREVFLHDPEVDSNIRRCSSRHTTSSRELDDGCVSIKEEGHRVLRLRRGLLMLECSLMRVQRRSGDGKGEDEGEEDGGAHLA